MTGPFLFVVNAPEFFLSHRLPLAIAVREAGFDVHVATGPGAACAQMTELEFVHHVLPFSRSGKNPFLDLLVLWRMYRLMRKIRPALVHLVTIKPVLYGGVAARLARVPAVVAAISGLGSAFVRREGWYSWLQQGIKMLYPFALRHRNLRVIFQNPDGRAALLGLGAVREEQAVLVRGSGVALGEYSVCPEPEGVPVVTFAARLLKDKGVGEFVEASRILKERGATARFWLVGAPDPGNPSSVSEDEVMQWGRAGLIEPLGYRTDISGVFAQSNIVVLPSYREGLPKVLIEAAACGRAVVTTDQPGCRDAIEPGRTGLLVPVRDSTALANAIQSLIEDSARRRRMGAAGRVLAEQEFDIKMVVDAHLGVYRELLLPERG